MIRFVNLKFKSTLSLWMMVALLCFVQFAKASHSIEHDVTAEQFHCQICSLVASDDFIEPNAALTFAHNDMNFIVEFMSSPLLINEIDRLNTARAPPISI
ncbi:MAG: hypothetical protein ACI9LM_004818 [Alteromonadaceae bacterium]|jgi:hypothetical protein